MAHLSVEQCEKLKEIGMPQDTYFHYWQNGETGRISLWGETQHSDYQGSNDALTSNNLL